MKVKNLTVGLLALTVVLMSTSCGNNHLNTEINEDNKTNISDNAGDGADISETGDSVLSESDINNDKSGESTSTISTSFLSSDGNVTVNINADVALSGSTELLEITVQPVVYNEEELMHVASAFAAGNEVYEYKLCLTKDWLQEQIVEKKAYIADKDYLMEYYGNNEDIVRQRIETVSHEIEQMEKTLANAPEKAVLSAPEYTYRPDSEYFDGNDYNEYIYDAPIDSFETFRAVTKLNGSYKYLLIEKNGNIWFTNDYRLDKTAQEARWKCYQTEQFTEENIEAAKKQILDTLNEIGIENYKITECEAVEVSLDEFYDGKNTEGLTDITGIRYVLNMRLEPEYYGEAIIDDGSEIRLSYSGGNIIEFWGENIIKTVAVSESKKLPTFEEAAATISACIAESCNKEFMMECGEMYMEYTKQLTDTYMDIFGNSTKYKLNIDKIEFGYIRTENSGSDTLIPVWAVYGEPFITEYVINNTTIETSTYLIPPHDVTVDAPLLLINAFDGLRIVGGNQD